MAQIPNRRGGGGHIWWGCSPQVPLHSKSDYFEDSAIDPKWTEWDVGNNWSATEAGGDGCRTLQTSTPADSWSGMYQVAPADNQFAITCFVRLNCEIQNTGYVGVMVGEDLAGNPGTSNFVASVLEPNGSSIGWSGRGYTQYNAAAAWSDGRTGLGTPQGFCRIWVDRVAPGAIVQLYSVDGRTWVANQTRQWGAASLPALNEIGICSNNLNTGVNLDAIYQMFRVDITADPFLSIGGY